MEGTGVDSRFFLSLTDHFSGCCTPTPWEPLEPCYSNPVPPSMSPPVVPEPRSWVQEFKQTIGGRLLVFRSPRQPDWAIQTNAWSWHGESHPVLRCNTVPTGVPVPMARHSAVSAPAFKTGVIWRLHRHSPFPPHMVGGESRAFGGWHSNIFGC